MEALKGLYHADKLDEQSFIENFTIRIKEFQLIIENLLQQKKKPLQHFLITGKRGMGKSTLLRRIYIEASNSPLNKKLISVRLGAEQYRLSRLFKLWEMVIEQLGNKEPELLKQKEDLEKSKQYEESIVYIINDYLTKTGKTLLVLIDNFDQFIEKIPIKDQHSFREALMLYPIQVIGNAVFYTEHFRNYDHPFFDFFKPIHLGNLGKSEAEEFIKLRAIGEGIENFGEIYKNQKGKINALRILSGGVPRTLLILLSIVSKKNTGDAVDYLHEMIEQVTPLYQDRMKALSAQQQEIMHSLAMRWDKTPVKELAIEMRIPSKSISAQLIQLERSGYVKKVDIPGRNHYYEIDERFFNIWLLMSEAAPHDGKRVIWLTKWLDAFYSKVELKKFAKFCQNELKKIKPGNRFLIIQALSESSRLEPEYKKVLINEIVKDLKDKLSEVKVWADNYNRKLTEEEVLLKTEIKNLIDIQDFKGALSKLNILEKIDEVSSLKGKGSLYLKEKKLDSAEKNFLMAAEKGDVGAMMILGYLFSNLKNDLSNAEKYYLMAVEKGSVDAMVVLGYFYAIEKKDIAEAEKYYLMALEKGSVDAMVFLGVLLENEKGDLDGAEKYFQMAADKDNVDAMVFLGILHANEKSDIDGAMRYFLLAIEKGHVNAMTRLGNLYEEEKKDIVEAEKYYQMAADKGDTDAMVFLGNLYANEKKDINEAEKYYQMAAKGGDVDALVFLGYIYMNEKKDIFNAEKYYLMAVEEGHMNAMFHLGYLYEEEKKDIIAAERLYLMAVEKGHVSAMLHLGYLYEEEKKDIVAAEKYYLMASEKGNVNAMYNLGHLYEEAKKDIVVAEKYYLMASEKGHVSAMYNLGLLYEEEKGDISEAEKYYQMAVNKGDTDAMFNLGYLYEEEKKDVVGAIKYYLMAVDNGNANAMFNLGYLYENEKKDFESAEKYYLMAAGKGESAAMGNLANMYYEIANFSQRDKALELSKESIRLTNFSDIILLGIHIEILLWNEKINDASKLMTEILNGPLHTDENMIEISEALQSFFVFKQKHFLYKLFASSKELIDRYKPIYYALLHEMQDEHFKEYLKMASELEEPVKAILDFVMKEQKRLNI